MLPGLGRFKKIELTYSTSAANLVLFASVVTVQDG